MKSFEDKLDKWDKLSLKVKKMEANEKKLIGAVVVFFIIAVIICVTKVLG
jgi:Trk-type K+ transport system membrane component